MAEKATKEEAKPRKKREMRPATFLKNVRKYVESREIDPSSVNLADFISELEDAVLDEATA